MTIDLHNLADRIAVEERIYRYAQLVDTMQFDKVADEIFTDDGIIDFGGARAVGRDAIHAMVMGYQGALLDCSHNITNLVIDVTGDEARSACRVLAWHWFADPVGDPLRPNDLLAIGGYEDKLRRTGKGWRIYERRGLNFGTGVGIGVVPEPMRPMFEGMQGRRATWPT